MDDLLLHLGELVADELRREGSKLTRATLMAGIRRRGRPIGTDRASELLRRLTA